jgi:membrane protein
MIANRHPIGAASPRPAAAPAGPYCTGARADGAIAPLGATSVRSFGSMGADSDRHSDRHWLRDLLTGFGLVAPKDQAPPMVRRDEELTGDRQALDRFAAGGPGPGWLRRLVATAGLISRRYSVDDVGTHSGALTYAALLSIPPLLVFSMSILGFVLKGSPSAQKAVINGLTSLVPSQLETAATQVLQDQLSAAISGKLSFGVIGLLGLLWSASGFAARIRHALGQIFGTARTGLLTGRVVGSIIGLLVVVSLFGFALLSGIQAWASSARPAGIATQIGLQVAVIAGTFAFFLAFYRLLTPGHGPGLRDHLVGALVFVVGWEVLVAVGGFFFARVVAKSSVLYGTLGTLFGVFAFLYATAWLFLVGAECSALRWDARRRQVS